MIIDKVCNKILKNENNQTKKPLVIIGFLRNHLLYEISTEDQHEPSCRG